MARLAGAAVALTAVFSTSRADAEPEPALRFEAIADGLAFHLVGDDGGVPWVLQHSTDGSTWEDLLFLEGGMGDAELPNVEVHWDALPAPAARSGFFRAVQFDEDDPFRRRYLAEFVRWRLQGLGSYEYELRQSFGMIFWHGTVNVVDGEVASFETIELQPPFFENPEIPTIDRLFGRIANAMAQDAEIIDVTWHPVYGFPSSCFIDFSTLIADEEQGWTIDAFTPPPL